MQTAIKTVDGEWYFSDEELEMFLNRLSHAEEKNENFIRLKSDRNKIHYLRIDKIIYFTIASEL